MVSPAAPKNLDPRFYQIAFQSAFLVFGTWALGWHTEWTRIVLTMGSCLLVQSIFVLMGKQQWSSLRSAFITGLGLSLLLQSVVWWIPPVAAVLAISSKFLIRFNGKHIFNPANFGMAVVILFGGNAWVSPGQWGSDAFYPVGIVLAGLLVLSKVKRMETGFVFLLSLFVFEFSRRYLYLGWPMDLLIHRFSSGSLLVYALFMITDPMTTPNHKKARIIWSITLAVLTFVLSNRFQIYEAPVWALFILSPFTPVFDKLFSAQKFQWQSTNTTVQYEKF